MYYNADAAFFFATQVLPLVRKELPLERSPFIIAGRDPPPQLSDLAGPGNGITVLGCVLRPVHNMQVWRSQLALEWTDSSRTLALFSARRGSSWFRIRTQQVGSSRLACVACSFKFAVGERVGVAASQRVNHRTRSVSPPCRYSHQGL